MNTDPALAQKQLVGSSARVISVIVPTFDRAAMLGRTLESISEQTYPDIEIVVVDDGSTDNTEEVVERFVRSKSRTILYVKQENRGCAAARNRGLQLASGDFLAFLDSDDAWLPTAANALADALLASGADFVYSPAIEVEHDGSERVNYPVSANHPELFAVEHFRNTNVRNGAFMFRRQVLSKVPGIDESLRHNEDSEFIQRMAVRYEATYCDSPTVKVYHHAGNKSRDRVAIYGALIKSAESLLEENPSFRARLGDIADSRLRELRTRYVEALIIAGEFDKARNVAAASKNDLSGVVRLAANMRSAIPLEIRDRLRAFRRHWTRKLKHVFG